MQQLMSDLADHARKGQLAHEKLRRLLVAPNLTQRDRARTVAVRLLDAPGTRRRLARGLRGEIYAGSLAPRALFGSLLGSGHFEEECADTRKIVRVLECVLFMRRAHMRAETRHPNFPTRTSRLGLGLGL